MMRSLWIAKTGLEGQQTSMDVISNNLANVATNGFKRGRAVFQDLMYQTLRQPRWATPPSCPLACNWAPARVAATERIHTTGGLNNTGGELDIAINGRGFLQVELPDGTQAYTRDGALQRNQNGQLTTVSGYVIQPPMNVPDNALSISIGNDGIVTVTQPGAAGINVQIGQLQIATFINPTGLQSVGENLYLETDASGPANLLQPGVDGAGSILHKYVETSNVNVAEELVNMITTQRAYEMNSKAVKTSDEMLARLTQL